MTPFARLFSVSAPAIARVCSWHPVCLAARQNRLAFRDLQGRVIGMMAGFRERVLSMLYCEEEQEPVGCKAGCHCVICAMFCQEICNAYV